MKTIEFDYKPEHLVIYCTGDSYMEVYISANLGSIPYHVIVCRILLAYVRPRLFPQESQVHRSTTKKRLAGIIDRSP